MEYMLLMDGQELLDAPMSLNQIVENFGPISKLEAAGFKIEKIK